MKPTFSNHILVDANIARSATDPADNPTAEACREVARTLEHRECPVGIAMTPALLAEWRKHASRIMTRWLVVMESRGRISHKQDKRVGSIRRDVTRVSDVGIRVALEKDLHITEAAITNSWPVISRDARQKRYLKSLHDIGNTDVGRIHWADPITDVTWREWLMSGCSQVYDFRCES